VSSWINKNDRVPEVGQRVQVKAKSGRIFNAVYLGYDKGRDGTDPVYMWDITDRLLHAGIVGSVKEWRPTRKDRAALSNARQSAILDAHPEWEALPDDEREAKIEEAMRHE
jgi:hypothetical protein